MKYEQYPFSPERNINRTAPDGKRKGIGLKWKLFLYLSGFAAILILILWLCQVVFLEDIYRGIKTAEIKRAADTLVGAVNDDNLDSTAESVGYRNGVCLIALSIRSNMPVQIASYDHSTECAIHHMSPSGYFTLYRSAVEAGGRILRHYRYDTIGRRFLPIEPGEAGDSQESIIYALVTADKNGGDVLILVNAVISPVGATIRTLNLLLITVTILMLFMALMLAALIARRISRPLSSLARSARKLGEGHYEDDFRGSSYREINELADTLNGACRELSKVDSLRRELIANTSHDLRTPLTMIAGYAEIMRDIPGENTPENVQIILDEAQRLTTLVNDMLDMSKIESGNAAPHIETFCLTDALTELIERYRKFTENQGYRIGFSVNDRITVVSDRSKLLQAIGNLINNAITYTGADKTVSIGQEIYQKDDTAYVRITVTDSGDGIPEDKLPLIWDRYYQADSAHKRSAYGSGLGLSIVGKIMTMLGGNKGVVSRVGGGSTFFIEIPAVYPENND